MEGLMDGSWSMDALIPGFVILVFMGVMASKQVKSVVGLSGS